MDILTPQVTTVHPDSVIVLSRGAKHPNVIIELKETQVAVQHLPHIKNATPATFPELVSVFTNSYYELSKAIGYLKMESASIDHELEYLRAQLLINEVPILLEARKLKSTVDTNNALIILDPRHRELSATKERFDAALALIEQRAKAITMAYYSLREIANMRFGAQYKVQLDSMIPDGAGPGDTVRRRPYLDYGDNNG